MFAFFRHGTVGTSRTEIREWSGTIPVWVWQSTVGFRRLCYEPSINNPGTQFWPIPLSIIYKYILYYIILYHIILYYIILYYISYYIILYYIILYHIILYYIILYYIISYYIILYYIILYYIILYYIILYYIILYILYIYIHMASPNFHGLSPFSLSPGAAPGG